MLSSLLFTSLIDSKYEFNGSAFYLFNVCLRWPTYFVHQNFFDSLSINIAIHDDAFTTRPRLQVGVDKGISGVFNVISRINLC